MSTQNQTYDNVENQNQLSAENKTFYERALLKRLIGALVYAKYGQKKSAPKKEGATFNFRRFNSLTPPTAALTEGVTPDGRNLSVTAITATVAQYGDFVRITDKLDMLGIDPVITETSEVLGESAAELLDNKVRDVIYGGTNVLLPVVGGSELTRATLATTNVLTSAEIKKAVKILRKNKAKTFAGGYFIGFIDPSCAYDLQNDTQWKDVSTYNGGTQIMAGEIGKIHGVRFIETANAKTFEGGYVSGSTGPKVEVHGTLIFGQDAYGVVDIEGSSKPEIIIKDFGSGDDPLNQRATVGYKTMFNSVILDNLSMVRIETGATEETITA